MSEQDKTQPPSKVDEPEDPSSENLSSPVTKIQELFASVSRVGPVPHPIYDKIEPEHATQILANAHENQQEELKFRRSGRWFYLTYVGIGIFAAGVGGGYGLKTYRG